MSSVKTNYFYSLLNTITALLFPVITFPYASRILLADGIGQINFYTSVISYISLLSCLGIPMYAIREISKVRDNIQLRNKISIEILILHLLLTFFAYLIIFFICKLIDEISASFSLFLLLSSNILLITLGCEWFYQGIEDFKYITIRGVIVKSTAAIMLFFFVKSKDDLFYYAIYTVVGTVGGNLFNFIRLKKYIKIRSVDFKTLNPMKHLKPALRIFMLNLIISVYVNLDSVMLGFIKDTTSVGYYTGATRLTKILLGLVSSLGTVMLPRLSNLVANGQKDKFTSLSKKAVRFVFTFSLPLSLGLFLMAPTLIILFCGPNYEPAISTLKIISPIIFFISLSNVLGIQILYPLGKEFLVIIATGIGALINFILNMILIPHWAQDGAAFATVCAELVVTLIMYILGRKHISSSIFKINQYFPCIISSVMMFIGCYYILSLGFSLMLNVFVIPSSAIVIYLFFLVIFRDQLALDLIRMFKRLFGNY